MALGSPLTPTHTGPALSAHNTHATQLAFLAECKKRAAAHKRDAALSERERQARVASVKLAVLGAAPFDGARYFLWAWSRHPNYCFEWCGWACFSLAAAPSAARRVVGGGPLAALAAAALLLSPLRLFYDCLVHWTGAAPAEAASVKKRPGYAAYQKRVNVLFPITLPLVDHCRLAGWPLAAAALE